MNIKASQFYTTACQPTTNEGAREAISLSNGYP